MKRKQQRKKLTPLGLLRAVKRTILREPKQFVMDNWYREEPDRGFDYEIPNCGTAACIAGWAYVIDKGIKPVDATHFDPEHEVIERLGFRPREWWSHTDETDSLFYTEYWPFRMRKAWNKAKTPEARAKLAAQRIEQFILEHAKHFRVKAGKAVK